MAVQQQSKTRWNGLVYLGIEAAGMPVYTVLTKTQIVEIAAPHSIEWHDCQHGCICGVFNYNQEVIPVVDLGYYFKVPTTVSQRNHAVKQLIVLRTTRIHHSRSQKLGICSSKSVQTMRLTVEQQKALVEHRDNSLKLLTDTKIVRSIFALPELYIALFNFDIIAEDATAMMMTPEMV
ncbi:MAG: hypothetical protein CSA29_02935 [Desulfobacterales bacterium]|nr:MAG: hypothetical protein CSA29_02935 [Desulfobacterales bacterium]